MSQPIQNDTQPDADLRQIQGSSIKTRHHVMRLLPGQDLKLSLQRFAQDNAIQAASLVTCVGSLTTAHLRLAGAHATQTFTGPFEITSLVGTLSSQGTHLHLCISDPRGAVLGGHLLQGNIIHTTAEITLAIHQDLIFSRPTDPNTGYGELSIQEA